MKKSKKLLKEMTYEMQYLFVHEDELEAEGYTFETLLEVNYLKEIALALLYWKQVKGDDKLLNRIAKIATDCDKDENWDYINEIVSDMWLEQANTEIEQIIHEIESEPI